MLKAIKTTLASCILIYANQSTLAANDNDTISIKIRKMGVLKTSSLGIKEKLRRTKDISEKQLFDHTKQCYSHALEMGSCLDKIFPYHGCDLTMSHSSLLDCFASKEAIHEPAAEQEIEFAYKQYLKHTPIKNIQQNQYDHFFSSEYPLEFPTILMKKYIKRYNIKTYSGQ